MSSTKLKTIEQFIFEAREVHGDKYSYEKSIYINNVTPLCIICPEHGEFWQIPKQHLRGQGCPECGKIKNRNNGKKYKRKKKIPGKKFTQEQFISILKNKYGDIFDYSEVKYINMKSEITLICPKHGKFVKKASALVNSNTGCPFCLKEKKRELFSLGKDNFVKRATELFHGFYNYDNVDYYNNSTKVEIICPKHGVFLCTPSNHLKGRGCPICKSEHYVYEERLFNFLKTFLTENDIIRQYTSSWLSNNKSLDFYIPKYNIAIEHQGSQHFALMHYSGDNLEKLYKRMSNDKIKAQECVEHNVDILYFSYEFSKIPKNCDYEIIFDEKILKTKVLNKIIFNKN